MKLKNKIYTLLSVFTLVGLTHSLTLKELNASLTAPTTYAIGFNGTSYLPATGSGLQSSVALFERTADGVYYNYYHRFRDTRLNPNHILPAGSGMHSNPENYHLPTGLDITMQFNRSNTNWTIATPYNGYYNTDTKIGSTNAVGTILNKTYLEFDNQTNKNYLLYLDYSSTSTIFVSMQYNSLPLGSYNLYLYSTNDSIHSVYLPSYTNVKLFNSSTNTARYFDAWYLQDLGVSDSYNVGIDAGELIGYDDGYADGLGNNPNILLNGFQAMVGILVNFMLMIVNLEVFGVSLINVFSILALFVGIVWILKIIRG
jgi:hypothetical protein